MMCLLEMDESGEIVGWVIGSDPHDLRRQIEANSPFDSRMQEVAGWLYRNEFLQPGKHRIPSHQPDNFILLVT